MAFSPNTFSGDFTTRYFLRKNNYEGLGKRGVLNGRPYIFPGYDQWAANRKKVPFINKDKEKQLQKDINRGPDNSVASWVWNFGAIEARLKALAARGKFAEAQDAYRQINKIIDTNFDRILELTQVANNGVLGEQMAERALRIANGTFASEPVSFMGQNLPLSAVISEGGELVASQAREEFEALGLSGNAADFLFNGSDRQKAVMKNLVTPLLNGSEVPNRLQRIDLAESVVNNWQDYEATFGEGLPYVIDRIQAAHLDSGGSAELLKTLSSYAKNVAVSRGLEGRDLAQDVISAYSGLVTQTFAQDVDPRGGPAKGSRQTAISPTRRMLFDAALSSAVKSLNARGLTADIKSPAFANAITEVLDAQAFASNYGIDLVGLGHDAGRSTSDAFGEYIADSVSLDPAARNHANPIDTFNGVRHMMNTQIVGGNDYAQQVFNSTGNAENYLNSVARANDGYSSCMGADAMASSVKSYLMRAMAPGIVAGKSAADSLAQAQQGSPHARTDFILGLSDVLSKYFTGPDRKAAGDLLASHALTTIESGKRLSMQDLVYDLAFGTKVDENNIPPTTRALRDWYNGNVTSADRFAQPAAALLAHYKEDEGLPDLSARSLVAKALSDASVVERRGYDPNRLFEVRMNVGTIYLPQRDPNTGAEVYVDPISREASTPQKGGVPVINPILADRRQHGYDGDDARWTYNNNFNRQRYLEAQKLMQMAQSKQIAADLKD